MKILMVCLGNICRSPLAEGILKQLSKDAELNWQIDSAGTNGYHVGENPHPFSCKVALEKGIDISQQVARKFDRADFSKYDVIYAMAGDVITEIERLGGNENNADKVLLLMEESRPGENVDIPDPWYGTKDGYYLVYNMIEEACKAIIAKHLKQSHV